MVYSITVSKLIEKMNLKNYTPEIDTDKVLIQDPGMNRPAVQFGGFFEHFDAGRITECLSSHQVPLHLHLYMR